MPVGVAPKSLLDSDCQVRRIGENIADLVIGFIMPRIPEDLPQIRIDSPWLVHELQSSNGSRLDFSGIQPRLDQVSHLTKDHDCPFRISVLMPADFSALSGIVESVLRSGSSVQIKQNLNQSFEILSSRLEQSWTYLESNFLCPLDRPEQIFSHSLLI